jgi:hypothetical protein
MCLSRTPQLRVQRQWICIDFTLSEGCTDAGRQFDVATKFCTMPPDMCGPSLWYLLLAPGILTWILEFWKMFLPLCLFGTYTFNLTKSSGTMCTTYFDLKNLYILST